MEFHFEIILSECLKIEFHFEIVLSECREMEFQSEIVFSECQEIEFQSEIGLSHSVEMEFHFEIAILHSVKIEFQHNTQAFLTGKSSACPRNALLPERKSPPHHRRQSFGRFKCHPAPRAPSRKTKM